MPLTRREIADDFDAIDAQIEDLNTHKREMLADYREQLAGEGMPKDRIRLEVDATKAAIKRRRAVAKDEIAVEEKDALVEEIFEEISRSRAPRATRVENIEEFDADTGEIMEPQPGSELLDPAAQTGAGYGGPFATSPVESEAVAISTPIQPGTETESLGDGDTATRTGSAVGDAVNGAVLLPTPQGAADGTPHRSGVTGGESAATSIQPGKSEEGAGAPSPAPGNVTPYARKPYDGPVSSTGLRRPKGCQHLDACAGTWREACFSCRKAMSVTGGGIEIPHEGDVA